MTTNKRWEEEFVEKGAEIEHERWAKWQKYVHKNLYNIAEQEPERWKELKNPHLKILPTELYERWERQINTPYSELSEQEKESDRKEARNYLPLVKLIESQAYQRAVEVVESLMLKCTECENEEIHESNGHNSILFKIVAKLQALKGEEIK